MKITELQKTGIEYAQRLFGRKDKDMNKNEWIKAWTTGKWEKTNKEVITFIADFLYADRKNTETVYNLFASGFCYYFATMLKTAFNRGTVCWHRNHGHIVWVDDNNIAYDIGGVFYDYEIGDLLDVEHSLGRLLVGFKHNGGEYHSGNKRFKDWAEHYGMSEIYAVSDIYRNMPMDEIDDGYLVEINALMYWNIHELELSEYYAKIKHEKAR